MEAEIDYIKANMGAGAVIAEEKEWDPAEVELKNEKKAIKTTATKVRKEKQIDFLFIIPP